MEALQKIEGNFNTTAKEFIAVICILEKREAPIFEKLSNDEILQIYSKTHLDLNDRLMRHRNKPIDADFLCALYDNVQYMPKSTRIILKSFL